MINNIYRDLPDARSQEVLETLAAHDQIRIERIVSRGQRSPDGFWYDQPNHEFVVLLRGAARMRFQDPLETVSLGPGDCLEIPAHRRHRVDWTSETEATIWLAVFYGDDAT